MLAAAATVHDGVSTTDRLRDHIHFASMFAAAGKCHVMQGADVSVVLVLVASQRVATFLSGGAHASWPVAFHFAVGVAH